MLETRKDRDNNDDDDGADSYRRQLGENHNNTERIRLAVVAKLFVQCWRLMAAYGEMDVLRLWKELGSVFHAD